MAIRLRFFFLFIFISTIGLSQRLSDVVQSYDTDSLFRKIESMQSSGNAYFDEGIFISYRQHSMSNKLWKDDNIFYSQIIVFTMGLYKDLFTSNQLIQFKEIKKKVIANYPKYKNKDGDVTYNFWKTKPSKHFPNSRYFSKHKKFILADDIDDTSMVYLTQDTIDDKTLRRLREKMSMHANGSKRQIKDIFKRYRSYKAYSTWFGVKMPIEFDICVLSNVMYMVYSLNLNLNENDYATLQLLEEMIKSKDHLKYSEYLSPSYKSNTAVLYHLTRLIADCKPKNLIPYKSQLINELKEECSKTNSITEKVMLSSSLMRFNVIPDEIIIDSKDELDFDYYTFYVANIASMFHDPFKRMMAKTNILSVNHICPAYNYTLLLENQLLYKRMFSKN